MSKQPTYINNLLPRLRQFSKSLNQKELFVDKPWVLQDDLGNRVMYIFYRDNKIKIIHPNGRTLQGTWSYNVHVNRLFINDGMEETSLKQDFVETGLMILKVDDATSSPWVVVNENIVPDLNVEKYLLSLLIKQMNLSEHGKANGDTIYTGLSSSGDYVYYDGNLNPLNTTTTNRYGKTVIYKNGRVYSFYTDKQFTSDKGTITIRFKGDTYAIGSQVFINNTPAPDDIYKIDGYDQIIVKNGQINKVKNSDNAVKGIIVVIGVAIFFIILVIAISSSNSKESQTTLNDSATITDTAISVTPLKTTNDQKISDAAVNMNLSSAKTPIYLSIPNDTINTSLLDGMNYDPVTLINKFLNALSSGNCELAWKYTMNPFWEKNGVNWFCGNDLFGGMTNISITDIELVFANDYEAKVYVEYSANEIKNGHQCINKT